MRVVRYYAKVGVFWPLVRGIIRNPFNWRSILRAYQETSHIVGQRLSNKYEPLMRERKEFYITQSLEHVNPKIVWFCWLQGLDQAPLIVRTCHSSLVRFLPDREIKFVDEKNWHKFVELPDYIIEKWERKQIPPAHFADLLRVQLLIRFGGTWIDATVLCTGIFPQNEKETLSYLNADLFVFQYTLPGSNQWGGISNWFISSCSNNVVLLVLRDMLFAYWKDYDCMIDYYIFHQFFDMIRIVYPEEIASMPYGYSRRSLALGYNWGKEFNQKKWDSLIANVAFHKLTYNVSKEVINGKNNYYHHIMDEAEQLNS